MKKRFTVYLDENVHERVTGHLGALGISLSGFLNGLLSEFDLVLQGQPTNLMDKPLKDLTLQEFGGLTRYWFGAVTDIEDQGEKLPKA